MRLLLTSILLAAALRLPVHRDLSKLPATVRASIPADFDPRREALAGIIRDGGTAVVLPSPSPLPTDGGSGTITLTRSLPMCRGEVFGEVSKVVLGGVLYRVPRNIGAVRVRIQTRAVEACPARPARDPNCVCQGIALSPEQLARGIHICRDCRAP